MAHGARPTSADVARRAGVSRATVSYVLNNAAGQTIPEATRRRVLEAARGLNYTPHAAARALRAGESPLVLLINTDVPYGPNLAIMIDALSVEVAATGRSLVLWQRRDPRDLAPTLAHLQPTLAIVLGRLDDEQRRMLEGARVPWVESRRPELEVATSGGSAQVRHLVDRGHRRIGYLTTTDPELQVFAAPRRAAVEATCAQLGLEPPMVSALPVQADISVEALAQVLRGWTGTLEPVTAVACYNDICAAACLAAADRAGIAVPAGLAVIGMDDEPMSAFTRPPLTTLRPDLIVFARKLWQTATATLQGGSSAPPPSPSFTLVERASV